jgi:DHA1 family multidrug resistance protein-like MFS transporter
MLSVFLANQSPLYLDLPPAIFVSVLESHTHTTTSSSSTMLDIIRDSTFGQIVRFGSGNRFFKYDEEREGFQVPDQYILSPKKSSSPDSSECSTVVDRKATPGSSSEKEPRSLEAKLDGPATSQELEDPFIVDWYGPDDPENPQ